MNNAVFPIIEEKENRLVAIDGNRSSFYKASSPDLEQLDDVARDNFFNALASWMNTLVEKSYYKLYYLNGSSYLDTDNNDILNSNILRFSPRKNPLSTFFGYTEIISDVGIYDDYLVYNGEYRRIISVIDFPEYEIDENFLPLGVDFLLSFKKYTKEQSVQKLENIRTGHLTSFTKVKKDIKGESSYEQAEDLLADIIHGRESLFEIELFFILKAYSLDDLNIQTKNLYSNLKTKGLKPFIEGQSCKKRKSGLSSIFAELIPGVKPKLKLRTHLTRTSHLQFLFPLKNSFLMEKGVVFFDRQGSEIYFNPFDKNLKNRNMLVTGTTGAGKSVLVNKIINHYMGSHYPTVILDMGGSFKRLTMYHDGVVLEKGFNPFQFKNPIYLREFILSMTDKDDFKKLDRGKLLSEIKKALLVASTFKELLNFLEKEFKGISLYFEDIKDYLNDEEIDINTILYVDVKNYPKTIVTPLIIFLLEYFKNIPAKEKILVFDECWSYLKDHSDYIEECFRTFRKSGAFPIAIAQSLSDFKAIGNNIATSITNLCHFKIFFPQEITLDEDLNSFDVRNIKNLRFLKEVFSECYLKSFDNSYRKTMGIYLTPLEYELFQTEAGEETGLFNFVDKFGKYFKSTANAIESFVRLKKGGNLNEFNFINNSN